VSSPEIKAPDPLRVEIAEGTRRVWSPEFEWLEEKGFITTKKETFSAQLTG